MSIFFKIQRSICTQHLVRSWQEAFDRFEWKPSSGWEHYVSLWKELLVSFRVLCWQGKELLVYLNNYYVFIWQALQGITLLQKYLPL